MSMTTPPHVRHERLSELVTQLSGAPLERSRQAVEAASCFDMDDELHTVADALVRIRVPEVVL